MTEKETKKLLLRISLRKGLTINDITLGLLSRKPQVACPPRA